VSAKEQGLTEHLWKQLGLFVPKEYIEKLSRASERPDIWRLAHGHVGVCLGMPGSTGRVLLWLALRLADRQRAATERGGRETERPAKSGQTVLAVSPFLAF